MTLAAEPEKVIETDLYEPVKAYLEAQGFEVKGEVASADVAAMRGEDLVIVELKTSFSLALLRQGIERQRITDAVYLAIPFGQGRAFRVALKGNVKLCRRLGLGLLLVRLKDGTVQPFADPEPYRPRKEPRHKVRLLKEFRARSGDPTKGGGRGQVMTAYRQDAVACARWLVKNGPAKGAQVARETDVARATTLMRDNHYGWFEKIEKGVYGISKEGRAAVRATRPEGQE